MNIETETHEQAGSRNGLAHSKSIIAVASGKGGVGKTWFSITLSHAFALKKSKVLLFDADLGFCLLYTSPSPRD